MMQFVKPLEFKDPTENLFQQVLQLQQAQSEEQKTEALKQAMPLLQAQTQAGLQTLPQETKTKLAQSLLAEQQAKAEQSLLPQQTQTQRLLLQSAPDKEQALINLTKAQTEQAKTNAMFTPDIKLALAEQKAKLTDPAAKAETNQFFQVTKDVSTDASAAAKGVPIIDQLLDLIPQSTASLGPAGGRVVAWGSTNGQRMKALISKLQRTVIQASKGIRNLAEFNTLIAAVGNLKQNPEALAKTLQTLRNEYLTSIRKNQFYSDYVSSGKYNPFEASNLWSNEAIKEEQEAKNAGVLGTGKRFYIGKDGRIYSRSEVLKAAGVQHTPAVSQMQAGGIK